MLKIHVMPRTPGAAHTEEWTSFCGSPEPFVVVGHQTMRRTSTNRAELRKHAFSVELFVRSSTGFLRVADSVWYPTLDAARIGAARMSQRWAKYFRQEARKGDLDKRHPAA